MDMIRILQASTKGKGWIEWMGPECIGQLEYIESKLSNLWSSGRCFPGKLQTLLPFIVLSREHTKLVVLCKEPYRSNSMACGIPVLSGDGMMTPSAKIFKLFIEDYWEGVTNTNYMSLYYESGILVLNSSFTTGYVDDKKYNLTESHFPLWTNFMIPLMERFAEDNVPILGLGLEAKGLLRGLNLGPRVMICPFPIDESRSGDEFITTMSYAVSEYVFDTTS